MAAPGEPETLDRSVVDVLLELGADIPGFSDELVGDFVASADRHSAAMRTAIEKGDREALEIAAHSLRGSSGIIGARRMAALCDEIERAAVAGALAEARPRLERLALEYPAAKAALDEAVRAAKARAREA